jgi:DNA repair exonuclease SbcCD ATPase subunit
MNESVFNHFLNSQFVAGEVGAIIHIGAGRCAELQSYLNLQPEKLIMCEASPVLCEALQKKADNHANIEVINKVIAGTTGEQEFYYTQPEQFSGLQQPVVFQAIFKNMKVVKQKPVKTTSLAAFIESLMLPEEKKNILVLQLNGEEANVLQNTPGSAMKNMDAIVIQQPTEVSNAGSVVLDENITKLLTGAYFQEACIANDDAIFTTYFYAKDRERLKTEALIKNYSELKQAHKALEVELTRERARIAQQQAEQRQGLNKIQEAVNLLRSEKENLISLNEQLVEKLTSYETRNNELEKDAEDLHSTNQQLTNLMTELEAERHKNERLEQQRSQLENEHSEVLKTLERERRESKELKDDANRFAQQVKILKDEVGQLEQRLNQTESKHAEALRQLDNEKSRHDELKGGTDNLVKQVEALKQESYEYVRQKEKIETELTKIVKERDNSKAELKDKLDAIDSLNKQLEVFRQQLAEKDRTISLGQKMLAKSQIDLDHLRESYKEKSESEKELVELVVELKEKLTLASKYYFQLQKEHPELIESLQDQQGND